MAEGFLLLEIACQLALLWSVTGKLRVFVRVAVFGTSLAFLVLLRGRGRLHPSVKPALFVLMIVAVSLLHPTTNSILSGSAQTAMYVAIVGPLFWVPRLRIDLGAMRRVLLIIFTFQTLSAAVGVLQVYYPGRFEPNMSSVILARGTGSLRSLQFLNAYGQWVFRPMGLTDVPGGAAMGGFYAALLGVAFFLTARGGWMRVLCGGSIGVGLVSIYLSQVRSVLVMLAVCLLAFLALLGWWNTALRRALRVLRRPKLRLAGVTVVVAGTALVSLSLATSIGGESVSNRLSTLTEGSPSEVYYQSRGHFLEYTIKELVPEYPLGAGLGRWGMMSHYFGDPSNRDSPPIWAEIQWTGWLLDGGIPLILAYLIALALAFKVALKVAASRTASDLAVWGALIFAYDLGALADTFASPFFSGQGGLDFWMLNAMLFSAARIAYAPVHNRQTRLR